MSNEKLLAEITELRSEKRSWEFIATELGDKYTPNMLRKLFYRKMQSDKPITPKILALDLETAPLEVYTWGLHDQNITLDMVIKDWSILSFCAKWIGNDAIFYQDNRKNANPRDDKALLKILHSLLQEADLILAHNGKSFDIPKLNARFILNNLPPLKHFRVIDTLSISKRNFSFTSNKLAYLSDKLCTKYKKQSHKKYPGLEMWKACLNKDIKAWKEMETYNKYDVLALEELYKKLAPWDNTVNFDVFNNFDLKKRCSCGSDKLENKGFVYTNSGKYDNVICKHCGKNYKGKENLLKPKKKKGDKRVKNK